MIVVVECWDCDLQLREDELIDRNFCPNCGRSNLFGYVIENED